MMILLSFAMCRTLVVLRYGHTKAKDPSVACREFTNAILTEFNGDSGFVSFEWCILVIAINIELVSCYDSDFGSFHNYFFASWRDFFFHFCLVFTWSLKYCKEGITAMKISSRFYYRFEKNPFIPSILTVCLVPFFNALTDQPLSDWSLPVVYSILTSFQYAEFLKQKNSESEGINVFEKQDRSKRKCAIT